MKEAIEKADILVEAIGYIEKFEGKIVVIKYGGNAMPKDAVKDPVLEDISMLAKLGLKIVIVHGGGPSIDEEIKKQGITKETIHGLRVTNAATLQIVAKILKEINLQCVQGLQQKRVKAEDCTEGTFTTQINDPKLGYVGDIISVNGDNLLKKIEAGIIPVISSLGKDENGQTTNINADTAATKVAVALKAEKLTILTNVDSVVDDENNRIRHIDVKEVEKYIEAGIIHGGMVPKVRACAEAASHGVRKAHLINGTVGRALLIELFTDFGIGTEVVK